MKNQLIHLQSATSSLVIQPLPMPEILYWGKRLNHFDPDSSQAMQLTTNRAIPQARIDNDIAVTLCPENSRGLYSSPGIEGHRESKDWAPVFTCNEVKLNGQDVEFICQDDVAQLALIIKLKLDKISGVLEKSISVTNLSKHSYQLDKLVSTLTLPANVMELQTFHGRWSREFQPNRVNITHGAFVQENRRGRTSHEYFPGFMAGSKNFTEQTGEVWGFHLGWSGNHQIRAEVKSDGRRFMQAGELFYPGEMVLEQNQSFTTPTLYACYSQQGLNGITTSFHQFVRDHIVRFPLDPKTNQPKPRPVHLNTWEGIYFQHDPKYIMDMATQAAEIGVERFIIDDGWFKGRDHDKAALGDWFLDTTKYPDGLEPVIEHVNNRGMEFGLWVEPEMMNPDSDLFRAHPEWLLALEGYEQPTGRYQYVLNLQNDDCFDYLLTCLDDLLTQYNIGYFKWDMNRELVQPAHNHKAAVHGQTKRYYDLVDQLRDRHPNVEIESCSSGGGRIDFEVLKRTHRFWASDCNDALERQTIQKGMGYFFPPEVMGAHIGPQESHTTRRSHHINLRGVTALGGHMGVELDPVKESEEQKQGFAHYIALHKQYRELLHSGTSFRLDSYDPSRNVYGVQSENEALVTVCQLTMPDYAIAEPLRFGLLDPTKQYQVTIIDEPTASFQLMKKRPDWVNEPVVISGEWLNEVGLSLPLLDPESAMLIHLKAV
ncbi:alpha-galactosidase [Vibrio sp. SS-MA-C1-2]|uniref:alpha-galactosidase n=1 Tax=Vibrio sp. SS-MA-C1-2 TaxID=2908646 RepID=UPI001F192752|nr:alpha-galactosidase [Vibrio sp. SS-MA-C1-2]UJF20012.1 alpha-galactosidase [Vibrio sp. SS-MA-C1-2]